MKLPSPADWVYMAMVVDKECHLTCPAFNCGICTLSTCVDIEELILTLLGEYGHGAEIQSQSPSRFVSSESTAATEMPSFHSLEAPSTCYMPKT